MLGVELLQVGRDRVGDGLDVGGAVPAVGVVTLLEAEQIPDGQHDPPEVGLAAISFGAHGSYPIPLTITSCAVASVRASAAVGSYE